MIKICKYCGGEFSTTKGNKVFCDDVCNRKYYSYQASLRRASGIVSKSKPKTKRKTKQKSSSALAQINAQARKMSMTYGQYMAQQYLNK